MSPTDPNQVEKPESDEKNGNGRQQGSKGATKTWVIETTEFLSKAAAEVFRNQGKCRKDSNRALYCAGHTKLPVNQNPNYDFAANSLTSLVP